MPLPSVQDIVKLLKGTITIEAQEKIMELRQGVMDLQEENLELRAKVQVLEARVQELLRPSLPRCPKCGMAAFALTKSEPDPLMGDLGAFRRLYKCNECGFSENRMETTE
jgi:uncharacterized protein with PIN domain